MIMRTFPLFNLVLIALLISGLGSFIFVSEAGLSNPGALAQRSTISITNNGEFDAAHGVTSGTGTLGDPYIIEDHKIEGGTSDCIEITGTTSSFVIRNCHLYNTTTRGINIDITSGSVSIENCVVNDTGGIGIRIHGTYDHCNITGVDVANTSSYGISASNSGGPVRDLRCEKLNMTNIGGHGLLINNAYSNIHINDTSFINISSRAISYTSFNPSCYISMDNLTINLTGSDGMLLSVGDSDISINDTFITDIDSGTGIDLSATTSNELTVTNFHLNNHTANYHGTRFTAFGDIQIENFTVTDMVDPGSYGIYVQDCIGSDINVTDFNGYNCRDGIQVRNSDDSITILEDIFINNTFRAFYFYDNDDSYATLTELDITNFTYIGAQFSSMDYCDIDFKDSVFVGTGDNMGDGVITSDFGNDYTNYTIDNVSISQNYWWAVDLDLDAGCNVAITNSSFFDIVAYGAIRLDGDDNPDHVNATIANCSFDNMDDGMYVRNMLVNITDSVLVDTDNAIEIIDVDHGIIKNVSISSVNKVTAGIGLNAFNMDNYTIMDCLFSDVNGHGVKLAATCKDNVIHGNYFVNNTLHAEDPTAGLNRWNETYSLGGGNFWDNYTDVDAFSGPGQDVPGQDGIGDTPHEITGIVVDNYPIMYNLDLEPPTSSILNLTYWHNSSFNISYMAKDDSFLGSIGLMYTHSLDNSSFGAYQLYDSMNLIGMEATGNFTFNGPDGHYRFTVNTTDRLGKTEIDIPAMDAMAAIDRTAPEFIADLLPNSTNDPYIEVNYTVNDTLSGVDEVRFYLSNNSVPTFNTYTLIETRQWPNMTAINFTAERGMYYKLYAIATDVLGNMVPVELSHPNGTYIETLPSDPPATNISIGDPQYGTDPLYVTSITLFTLNSTDPESDIDHIWYSLDGSIYNVYTGAFSVVNTTTQIRYGALDLAGNNETEQLLDIIVDDIAPVTTISYEEATRSVNITNKTMFTLTAVDIGCGVDHIEYKIGIGSWMTYTGPFNFEDYRNYQIYYRSIDNLGNVEDEKEFGAWLAVPKYELSGKITYSGGDLDGEPAEGARITLWYDDMAGNGATTAMNGEYSFDMYGLRNYTIQVEPNGTIGSVGEWSGYLEYKETLFFYEDKVVDIELEYYEHTVTINGTVKYSGGELNRTPAVNATVTLVGPQTYVFLLDATGTFSLTVIAGDYSVQITPPMSLVGIKDVSSGYLAISDMLSADRDKDVIWMIQYYVYVEEIDESLTIYPITELIEPGQFITIQGNSTGLVGETVTVALGLNNVTTTIDANGYWSVSIEAPSNPGPYNVMATAGDVSATTSIEVEETEEDGGGPSMVEPLMMAGCVILLLIVIVLVGVIMFMIISKSKGSRVEGAFEEEEEDEVDDEEDLDEEEEDEEEEALEDDDLEDLDEEEEMDEEDIDDLEEDDLEDLDDLEDEEDLDDLEEEE